MPLISIIVPVYNVESYLKRCIESILNQTFRDFELILVNDGSTDNSEIICKEYALKDERIKYFYQRNKGVSEARNKGIDNSSGDYIQFIDSDDYVDENFLEIVVNRFKRDNSDIVFIGFYNEYDNGEIYKSKYYKESIVSNNIKEHCLELYKDDLFGYTWCKAFKGSIIKKFNLKFDKNMNYCEDELFTCEYCKQIKTISIESKPMYHYIDYKGNRCTLTSKEKDEISNRDKLFNGWVSLLGNHYEKYLNDKAYKTIRFLFFNEVWSDKDYEVIKSNINKIKETTIMKYIYSNNNLRRDNLIKWIKYGDIRIFKLYFRIMNKMNLKL